MRYWLLDLPARLVDGWLTLYRWYLIILCSIIALVAIPMVVWQWVRAILP